LRTFLVILPIFYLSTGYSQDLFFEDNQNSKNKNEIVAEVGPLKITAEEFIYSYEFGPAFPKRKDHSKQTYLSYMINEKLLALDGYENGMMEKETAKEIYSDIESDLASEEMFRKEIIPEIKVDSAEIEKVIEKKLSEYYIKWLYAEDLPKLENLLMKLKNKIPFDSLFNGQLTDSVLIDDRQLTSSLYSIYLKNPQIAQIVDSLNPGKISDPIHTSDGWYIVKIENIWKNMITSESEYNKLKSESTNAIAKSKMDFLSDQYVKGIFSNENPIIKRDVFNMLRSYLGKFILLPEKYSEWELDNKLDVALTNLGLRRRETYPGLTLVECKNSKISLDEFIIWYRNREQYVKFSKNDLIGFSKSLEDLVWVMVRDNLLTAKAYQKGYNKSEWVKKQASWWKDKISYSLIRSELSNSVMLSFEEKHSYNESEKSQSESMNQELSKKIFNKVRELKKKYKIVVNEDVLDKIKVSSENDKKAIDMYIVKRGNLIPRPAYPSIENDWVSWE